MEDNTLFCTKIIKTLDPTTGTYEYVVEVFNRGGAKKEQTDVSAYFSTLLEAQEYFLSVSNFCFRDDEWDLDRNG